MTVTTPTAEDEVPGLCRDLIRIDSTNYGDGSGPGERECAEQVAAWLVGVGLEPTLLETGPRRANVVARVAGRDPQRSPLLVHCHLDVVPADPAGWTLPPFAGEIVDGVVWGRGAVDMKDMDAMVLSVVRARMREGRPPARDLVLAFVADEEAGSTQGAHRLVSEHAELFDGIREGIGEVGGFSVQVGDRRLYLVEAAEKGLAWMRLVAEGRAGHGSMINNANAVTEIAQAVAALGLHRFPVALTDTTRRFLAELAEVIGTPVDPADPDAALAQLGPIAAMLGAGLRNTANPTVLAAGLKHNVIPGQASALVDGRFLPGQEEEFLATVDRLVGPTVRREMVVQDDALEHPFDGDLVQAMRMALVAEDPAAAVLPYLFSGGTDAKAFSRLGVAAYGFSPLRLPADMDFAGMFHNVDERVPVDALRFGVRVLDRFLDLC